MDDADLVARARGGDRSAWGAIYDRYADRLHDHCWSILRDEHEAADALHDAFVAAAGAIDQLRDPARLRPWLYAIARNEAFRRHRRRSRAVPMDELPEVSAVDDEVGATGGGRDLQQLVWDAAGGLSPDDKSLLDLHLRQGLDGQDLAEALGITANNAYVKLHRLRETLERSLGALLVARTGSEDCEELQRLVAGWDGALSPLLRKRIARHVDGCDVCGERKRRLVSPLALLAAVPLVPAPAALRERILDDTVAASSTRPAGGRRRGGRGPRGRGGLVLGVAAAVLVVALLAAVLTAGGGDEPAELVTAGEVDTTTTTDTTVDDDDPATSTSTSGVAGSTTIPAGPVVLPAPTGGTVPPGAPPPPPPPPTTAGPTSLPPPPPPGVIELSTGTLDFGDAATTRSLTVRNTGGQPVDVTATPGSSAVSVSPPGTTTIAPGQSVDYTVGLDRSGLPEGPVSQRVRIGGQDVAVTGTVRRPPTAGAPTISPSRFQTTCAPDNDTATVSAAVADDSGIRSVVFHFVGPDRSGSEDVTGRRTWTLGPFRAAGAGEAWIVVTDVHGNESTSARRPFDVDPCPG